MAERVPHILSIAGIDPSGGAGSYADLKSIAANGGYGLGAVTALTVQNTVGVRDVHVPPAPFLTAQLDALADDIGIDAVKTGMLANAEVIAAVTAWVDRAGPPALVVDPVMIATSGDRLLDADAERALRELISRADVVTPNVPELAVLAGAAAATDWSGLLEQARTVAAGAGVRVVAKGGHLSGAAVHDALVTSSGEVVEFTGPRVDTRNTHGTGCSLASALATRFVITGDWAAALGQARDWLAGAIAHADELDVGRGHGPVQHFFAL